MNKKRPPRGTRRSRGKKAASKVAKPVESLHPRGLPAPVSAAFPVVGIGASAGGLEALEKFFANLPSDSGIAFVVVTHQHPGHSSMLPELLSKCTQMRVLPAADGVAIEPNRVYMSLPEGYMAILHGTLHLMEPDGPGLLRLPIDYFLRSLAEDQKEKAIAIVLSGTGTDGTLGLKAVKGAGGMTMAQQPESAKYAGMPQSAISTGMVDYVLPVEQMAKPLVAYARGPYLALPDAEDRRNAALSEPMQKIIVLLRARVGQDFSLYKPNTICRRIERRINVHRLRGPLEYLRLLQESPHELDLLFKELLIGVTNFFRDPEAFTALARIAVPRLLSGRSEDAPLRVWVPGCSTGEEAYSLAILLQENMSQLKRRVPVQIFGTDLDAEAIESARAGLYTEGIARDVRTQRLARFFVKEEHGYRVNKEIREMAVFARQNVLKDPPFTKLDLVSCRNLLIYLKPEAQQRLLSLFQYALKPGGILLLGSSENITLLDHFTVLSKKWKLYARKETDASQALPKEIALQPSKLDATLPGETTAADRGRKLHAAASIEKALLSRFAPASVVVNDEGNILYIHGRTGDYLEPASGQPRLNVLEMAREGLRLELASALREAAGQKREVVHEGVRVKTNGHFISVRLAVTRMAEPESLRGLLLVTFQAQPAPAGPADTRRKGGGRAAKAHSGRLPLLERELRYTRETLQSTVEELEASNEELKSTNEELQSTNEELQSTNEELETSKEEMQSLNEELQTVNAQLQAKLEDLAQANDDMQNLLNCTTIATIFLDQELCIKRFTAEATKLVNLIPSDAGRPISDLASNMDYPQLAADAAEVLRKLVYKEKEVQTRKGGWRQVRISPYRTTENVIDGLVITFVDITQLKKAEQLAQQNRIYAESIVSTVREPLIILGADLRVVSANRAFYRAFGTSSKAVEHRLIYEINDRQWDIPALRKLLEDTLPLNTSFEDFRVTWDSPKVGRKEMVLNARRVANDSGAPEMILLAIDMVR